MTNRKSAFTLLELLVVIAILALLIGILIPSLTAARESAKANVCLSHIKMLGTSFSLYLNENEDKFPPVRIETTVPGGTTPYVNDHGRAAPRWQWFLNMNMGPLIDPKPFAGAIQRTGYFHDETRGRAPSMEMSHDAFTCPTLSDPEIALHVRDGAYGYNYQYLGNSRQDKIPGRWDNFPMALHRVRSSARTVVLADSRGTGPRHGQHSYTLDPPRLATESNATRFGPVSSPSDFLSDDGDWPGDLDATLYQYSPVEARHKGRANVVFVDTHAESMSLSDLGYEFDTTDGVPKNTPKPIHDPTTETYKANNSLWTGLGTDLLAQEQDIVP